MGTHYRAGRSGEDQGRHRCAAQTASGRQLRRRRSTPGGQNVPSGAETTLEGTLVLVLVKQMAARLKRWAIRRKPHPFRRRILRLSFVIALVAGWVFEDWLSHLPVFQVASLRLSEDLLRDAQRRNAVSAQRVTLIEIDEG